MDYSIALTTLQAADPILAAVIQRVGDCQLVHQQSGGDLLSALAESIIYQQLSGKAAATIHQRFLQLYTDVPDTAGSNPDGLDPSISPENVLPANQTAEKQAPKRRAGGTIDRCQLTAAAILNTPDDVLRGVGLSRAKSLYIKDLAQKVADGLPSLEELDGLDDESIIQTVTQVKGIGRWTAQMLLMFRLHRWDVLPVDDLGIRSGIRRLYDLPELPTRQQVEQIGAVWKPYRTIACWYVWRSLEG